MSKMIRAISLKLILAIQTCASRTISQAEEKILEQGIIVITQGQKLKQDTGAVVNGLTANRISKCGIEQQSQELILLVK
jgi:hypothetical protein